MSDMSVQQQQQRPVQPQQEVAQSQGQAQQQAQQVGDQVAAQAARAAQGRPAGSAQVEATASVQQGAGEKFQRFADTSAHRGEPAMPAGPSGTASVKAEARIEKTPEQQLNDAADRLAARSPTARQQLEKFRAEGGRIVDGGTAGYFKDGAPPEIGIPTRTPMGTQTSERERMQTIAHELGHHNFARTQPQGEVKPSYGNGGQTDAQIEARRERNYTIQNAERHLSDEAHATRFNAKVRDEVKRHGGPDIGIAGVRPGQRLPNQRELVDQYGRLTPSTSPNETYREYYNRPYREHYQKYYAPGQPGNLR